MTKKFMVENYESSPVEVMLNHIDTLIDLTNILISKVEEQSEKLEELTEKVASMGYGEKYGTNDPLSL